MLVLSRKIGERIHIGDGIEIAIVDVRGSKVRIGIEAPAEVSIRRSEISMNGRELSSSGQSNAAWDV